MIKPDPLVGEIRKLESAMEGIANQPEAVESAVNSVPLLTPHLNATPNLSLSNTRGLIMKLRGLHNGYEIHYIGSRISVVKPSGEKVNFSGILNKDDFDNLLKQ